VSGDVQTKWIVAAVALGAIALGAITLIVVQLTGRDAGDTRAVEPPTTITTTTTTAVARPTTTTDPGAPTTTERPDLVVERIEVPVGGAERTALTISPLERGGSALPAVVVLHGLGVNANAMSRAVDWREAVANRRFIAVFPQGIADSWNLGPCCPPASLAGVRDLDFLDQLLDDLVEDPGVDADRVYLTGFSNGGLMVYELACRRSDTFAAVAPMAASNLTGCSPSQPLSLLHQHADPDPVVPYGGGLGLGSLLSVRPFPAVPGTVAAWAEASGCSADPAESADADVERFVWQDCADGVEVELVRVPGRGHQWLDQGSYVSLDELLGFFDLS